MIVDTLAKSNHYLALLPRLQAAFDFLKRADLNQLADGRYDIEGDALYAMLQSYQSHPVALDKLEAHRRYADIQMVLQGNERFGWCPLSNELPLSKPYDEAADIVFYNAECDFITLRPGLFALVLPHDGHQPGCQTGAAAEAVRKVVIKLRMP